MVWVDIIFDLYRPFYFQKNLHPGAASLPGKSSKFKVLKCIQPFPAEKLADESIPSTPSFDSVWLEKP